MDRHTGEILAMVSRPIFDPNRFAVKIGRDDWNKLMTDPDHPLLNKAIQAQLAPGSTFKVIMAVAGLEENVAQTLKVNCGGGASFYGRFFACDARHGPVDIHNAIQYSCDTYFYTLAERLGIEKIANWAHQLGIGRKTGVDLPNEVSGTMPSEEWAMKNYHRKWYAGETISVGIGQGAVALTPIQLARAIGGIASGGALQRPHVVLPNQLPAEYEQAMLETYAGSGTSDLHLDPASWEIITDGMAAPTSNCPFCTAHASHLDGIDFAGKTGTAQVLNHSFGAKLVSTSKSGRANAWFVGVAPRRNPDIVVAVLWEHGGWGAGSAHLAAQVIETFVDKQRRLEHNLQAAPTPVAPAVEVGAMWSAPGDGDTPAKAGVKQTAAKPASRNPGQSAVPAEKGALDGAPTASLQAGRFWLPVGPAHQDGASRAASSSSPRSSPHPSPAGHSAAAQAATVAFVRRGSATGSDAAAMEAR